MKLFVFLFIFISFVFGEKLIIDSSKFEADDAAGITIFTGNVKMVKTQDIINSDKLTVYMITDANGKKTAKEYVAIGKVDFKIVTNGKIYSGNGDKVIYNPNTQKYTILGNGFLFDQTMDRKLYGNEIFINELSGEATVNGDDSKPVRFIIKLEDK